MGDAAARTDRLVVDLLAGGLVVVRGPLGDDRIDERRTGTGDVGGLRVEGEAEPHGGDSCVEDGGLVDGCLPGVDAGRVGPACRWEGSRVGAGCGGQWE